MNLITQLDNYDEQLREHDRMQAQLKFAKERLESMTPEERQEIIIGGRHQAIQHKPQNVRELHQAVKAIYGISVPMTSTHPDFHAPMEAMAALYFGTYENIIWLASRGGSKTLMASITSNILNSASPEFESIHAGGTRTQARVAAKYLANFYKTPPLEEYFDGPPGVFQAKWKNGALWEIITGSYGGVCLSGWTSIITDQGNIPIREIVAKKLNCKVKSFDFSKGEVVWMDIIDWHDNGPERDFIKIKTKYQTVRELPSMTPNHVVFLADGTEKQAGDIKAGESIAELAYMPSNEEYQVIIGSLLGDASVTEEGRYSFAHGDAQEEYSAWKAQALSEFKVTQLPHKSGFTEKIHNKYRTEAHILFKQLRDAWYSTGKKQINYAQLQDLDDLGVAVWFMDDGCYNGDSWSLWTSGFDHDSQEAIQRFFKDKYGVGCSVDTHKDGYYIRFCVPASEVINEIVEPYIDINEKQPSGWKRWIYTQEIPVGKEGVWPNEVLGIEDVHLTGDRSRKYDLTIAGHHNYFLASGLLVHNSGQHPMMLTLDEIEVWEIEALMQTFEVPLSRKGYRRRWAAFSTRQRSFGGMRWLVDEAPIRKFQLYQWTMFETMQPCITCEAIDKEPHGDDLAREKICVLWEHCKGERAKKASGWLTLEQARDKCIRLGGPRGREFLTQGVCTRPSSHGLVLHNFEKLNKPEGNYTRWTFIKDLPWYAVHDPAEGKKSVILFIQRHEGCSYIFDELVNPTCATTTQAKQEFHEHCVRMNYGDPVKVIVDPHRTDAVADWRMGSKSGEGMYKKYMAETPNIEGPEKGGVTDKIDITVEMLRKYICDGAGIKRFYVNKDYCPMLDRAIGEYHYPVDRNTNEVLSNTPHKAYSDEIDPMRYWVMWLLTRGGEHGLRILLM